MKRTAPSLTRWLQETRSEWDAVVFDIDGVLVLKRNPLPGARELVSYLRRSNIPIKLLTNDGNNSVQEKRRILASCGLDFQEEQITSSGHALADIVRDTGLAGKQVFIMGKLGDPCYAEQAGVGVTRDLEKLLSCSAVIMGEEGYAWEPTINGVVNFFIQHPQAPFIVPNPDLYFPTTRGEIRVAAGGVAEFIRHLLGAYGVSVVPVFLGKPYSPIFRHCHRRLEALCGRSLDKNKILMVGDSLAGDIQGARGFGYRSALILTGLTTEEMLSRSQILPDHVFPSL